MPDAWPPRPPLAPVILVPGLVGSAITGRRTSGEPFGPLWCVGVEWSQLWLQPALLMPNAKDCLLRALELHYNASSGIYSNTSGVELDASVDWGGVNGVAYLSPDGPLSSFTGYFSALVDALTARGYTPGLDLHGAPYDWRLAPDAHLTPGGYYGRLRLLIETSVSRSGRRAWVVAHSLGCPTASAFFSRQPDVWLRAHVKGFVALAGVWAGGASMVNIAPRNLHLLLIYMVNPIYTHIYLSN